MEIVLGKAPERLRILLSPRSVQSFALEWTENTAPADFTSRTVVIEVGTQTWTPTITGNRTQWDLNAVQTNITKVTTGRLLVDGRVAFNVTVEPV